MARFARWEPEARLAAHLGGHVGAAATTSKDTLTRIIEMQPGSESAARAHYELGGLHLSGGNLDGATSAFRQVPAAWPRWHSRAGLAIGRIYQNHWHDLEAAAREYRKVIRLHPDTMAAADGYAHLADIHQALGDHLTAENMRECAVRTYDRVMTLSRDADERDLALERFVRLARALDRRDLAVDALVKRRREAASARVPARLLAIDSELGDLYFELEQHGNALLRYKSCAQIARRGSEPDVVLRLLDRMATCQELTGDRAGARRTWRSTVEYVARSRERASRAERQPGLAVILARAYAALERPQDIKKVRSRLARYRSADVSQALAAIDGMLQAQAAG